MLNIVALQGRLVADPGLRTTNSGTPVCSFTLAVQRNMKGSDGEYNTDWVDCVAWKGTAEFICKYFQKGQLMAVNGTLQTRSYEKDGVKCKATQVVVENANFCESKRDSQTTHKDGNQGKQPMAAPPMEEFDDIFDNDTLPF